MGDFIAFIQTVSHASPHTLNYDVFEREINKIDITTEDTAGHIDGLAAFWSQLSCHAQHLIVEAVTNVNNLECSWLNKMLREEQMTRFNLQ